MIVVRVELWSAITGRRSELARMYICNEGGTEQRGDYGVRTLIGRSTAALDQHVTCRQGKVTGHARLREHVWNLVSKALTAMSYGEKTRG